MFGLWPIAPTLLLLAGWYVTDEGYELRRMMREVKRIHG